MILDAFKFREIFVSQLQTLKEHQMKRIALVAALLTLALTACGQKTETPAVVAPTPAAVVAPDAASAPVAVPATAADA
ncbi:MAG: hypothetical protein ABI536_08995, partial [Gallionella sp.]